MLPKESTYINARSVFLSRVWAFPGKKRHFLPEIIIRKLLALLVKKSSPIYNRHEKQNQVLRPKIKVMTKINPHDEEPPNEADRAMKIQALRDMVLNAEKTIQGAKAMLLQLEGKKKTGRPRKTEVGSPEDGTVVEGTFDGQLMTGTDGKQYPVPANYASKSKLVEGDMLKLTITPDGTFLYKQIGPIERRHAIGIVTQDENGNYYVLANGKPYRILLASITYFKAIPGDEVAVVLPRDLDASWAAIENIIQKGAHKDWQGEFQKAAESNSVVNSWKKDLDISDNSEEGQGGSAMTFHNASEEEKTGRSSLLNSWVRDMEDIEKEINQGK